MMKYLLLIVVVGLVFFLLGVKRSRPTVRPPKAEASPKPAEALPQDMVSCAYCGLHLPQTEALPGRGGQFCSAAHRAAHEAGHSA
jgi:uncharacterized protein